MAIFSRSRKPHAAVVYNPLKVDLERLKKAVTSAQDASDWATTLWFPTSATDAGTAATATALRRGADVVIAAGGDGTVRAVAEALRGSGVPLALLPAGTANLLARNLDLPIASLEKCIEIALNGVNRSLDLGMVEITRADGSVEQRGFVVMAGLGLDAKMIKNTSTTLKKAVGWLAYVDGITRSLPELKPLRVTYNVDGGPERTMNAHTVIVGNCGMLPGGLLLMPAARPDDGILDIAALRPRGPFGWAKVWRKVAWENGVLRKSSLGRKIIDLSADVRDVTNFTGSSLTMSVPDPQEFQLDGDAFGEAKSVRIWAEADKLTVRAPAARAERPQGARGVA